MWLLLAAVTAALQVRKQSMFFFKKERRAAGDDALNQIFFSHSPAQVATGLSGRALVGDMNRRL